MKLLLDTPVLLWAASVDRLLAAQALDAGYTLVTRDNVFVQ